jgi:hypothetical protein
VRAGASSLVVKAAAKKEMMMWEALREGLDEEMERDPTVCMMGAPPAVTPPASPPAAASSMQWPPGWVHHSMQQQSPGDLQLGQWQRRARPRLQTGGKLAGSATPTGHKRLPPARPPAALAWPPCLPAGEDVGHYGGSYKVSSGLYKKYGDMRLLDTPICENGFMGMGVGAAMTGLRPIVEGMNMGFLLLAFNQISNNCGMLHYTSGGQYKVPMVIRGPGGVGRHLGAEHSQRLESYFQSIPGGCSPWVQ